MTLPTEVQASADRAVDELRENVLDGLRRLQADRTEHGVLQAAETEIVRLRSLLRRVADVTANPQQWLVDAWQVGAVAGEAERPDSFDGYVGLITTEELIAEVRAAAPDTYYSPENPEDGVDEFNDREYVAATDAVLRVLSDYFMGRDGAGHVIEEIASMRSYLETQR